MKKHIAETCNIHSITDFGDLPVFKGATAYPMIFIAQNKILVSNSTIFTQVKSLEPPYPDISAIIQDKGQTLPTTAINGSSWTLTDTSSAIRMKKMEATGIPLGEYVNGQIYYGVKTGFNKAFIIDDAKRVELIAQDPRSAEIIKPLTTGKNIEKWSFSEQNKWLIFTRHGININEYPAIRLHLNQWRTELEPKPPNYFSNQKWLGRKSGSYKWYEIQDNVAYYTKFANPKIVYQTFQVKPCFAYDNNGMYINNSLWMIALDDLYLLGVLNCQSFWSEINRHCTKIQNGYQLIQVYLEKAIVPNASTTEREAISQLVQKCLDAKGVNCETWEKEIDERVAALYSL
ncbi:TaqI-like C-terminal specificity domain-containing protein [Nostoc sp.]|uniref:TaqI-like C-terminal specificity domain-containing protein n=1 Tax=Nostoc sp. TaxID=1180 RepID=UPI002FF7BF82